MRFDDYLSEDKQLDKLLEVAMFMEEFDYMNEGIGDFVKKVKGFLPKLGLHASKSGPGLIHMLKNAGTTMAKFFWHAMKAATGNKESADMVKQLANKEIKKEDVINFLLKLDTMTLHLVTGPIHAIEAATGWHIGVHIKSIADDMMRKTKDSIDHLLDVAKTATTDVKKKILQYVHGLRRLVGLSK